MEYKIKYSAQISCLNIENSIEFEIMHNHFIKAIIEKEKNLTFGITLFLNKRIRLEEVQSEANEIVDSILNKIAYYCLGTSVGNPVFDDSNLPKATGFIDMNCSGDVRRPKDIENLRNSLDDLGSNTDQLYKIYRAATNAGDIVSRFMFLYQILLDLKGPAQWMVDNFIKQELKADAKYKIWQPNRVDKHGNKIYETKLTYLRNCVGHHVDVAGVTPDKTRTDMQGEMYSLTKVVKIAIEEKVIVHL